MRRILDESLPVKLARALRDHDCLVQLFPDEWRGLDDGVLLDRFDTQGGGILLTCDRNMQHQQRFDRRKIGLVILPGQRLAQLLPIAAEIASIVQGAELRQIITVDRAGRASHQPI